MAFKAPEPNSYTDLGAKIRICKGCRDISRVSNIESDSSQNVGLENYNNISVGIFPYFTTPSIKICLG